MVRNGKYFVAPKKSLDDFKVLFARLAAEGAGRPVDRQGFADGPWTPEKLADAISSIDANRDGIELRAVQMWFQDNENGISNENIYWLARIFGCNDPEATSLWQAELRAAKNRLTSKRRANRLYAAGSEIGASVGDKQKQPSQSIKAETSRSRINLAKRTEALFIGHSPMVLPLTVFTGACVLALIAFKLNVHSVVFTLENGTSKQVGFLWAPNWTIVFLAVLPMFLALVVDLMRCWTQIWRPAITIINSSSSDVESWDERVRAAAIAFWIVFFVTIGVASGYNWIATHLIPLLSGDTGGWPVNWGRIAVVRPDLVSPTSAIAFSGIVFIYNGLTAYLFFAGLVFLLLLRYDFEDLVKALKPADIQSSLPKINNISLALMNGIFRCAALGVIITILMKLQSSFLRSGNATIIEWLLSDVLRTVGISRPVESHPATDGVAPGSFYSFFCLLAIAGTFASASIRIRAALVRLGAHRTKQRVITPWTVMNGCMSLLVVNYFVIGVMPGFAVLLVLSLVLTVFLLSRPAVQWSGDVHDERLV